MLLNLAQAVQHLHKGQVVAYPTEAVWGLGCDPFNPTAFEKILTLKQRPIEKGVILLAADLQQVMPMLQVLAPHQQQQVIASWHMQPDHNLPPSFYRATTWLLPHAGEVPEWITGQHELVAVRVTQHPLCSALCRAFGGFMVSTSANLAGLAPARSLLQAQRYFADAIGYLDGPLGTSQQPSRILNALTGEVIRA